MNESKQKSETSQVWPRWRLSPSGEYVLSGTMNADVVRLCNRHIPEICKEHALVLAAPDLLEAVKSILFQVCQGKVLERDACVAQARAALAKANGGAA